MDRENRDFDNPFTEMKGYRVLDTAAEPVGTIEDTVYDEVSDVLKYVIVDGRPVPAEEITVDADQDQVVIPFDAATVKSAPRLEHFSGAFDEAVREHYERER